jgi:hypothetical protein
MRNRKIFISLAALLFLNNILAMSQVLDVVQKKFDTYRQNHLQEKIFMHTDKNFYLAGEIVWFKIYTVDASFHTPIDISKVVYVELLDNMNRPVLQAKVGLSQGTGSGSLYVPVAVNSGNYKLRAYTNWMKNYSVDYFFEKPLTVVNSQKAYEVPAVEKKIQYDIQFFPEGGNLVQDMQSTIAFKATDQDGKGIECTGAVIADDRDTVARFRSFKFGIGSFGFTPVTGHHYSALLIPPGNARTVTKELPQVFKEGYVMSIIDADSNRLIVKVACNISAVSEVYLFAHSRESVKLATAEQIKNGTASFTVNKKLLSDGISHLTIFNASRQPVCERLYFKAPSRKLNITVNTDQAAYAMRKKVTISLNSGTQGTKGEAANLSMSVYRVDSLQLLDESTISSYLWLASDLKGTVESPWYYFNSRGAETSKALDNLMLTQGWRRFRWEDVMKDNKPYFEYPPEYKGHLISGKVTNSRNGKNGVEIMSYLSVPGRRSLFSPVLSDSNGRANFEMRGMYGSSEIVLQTNPQEDSAYRLEVANPFYEKYSSTRVPKYLLAENQLNNLLDQSIGMQVQNIYTGDSMQKFYINERDTTAFYVNSDKQYLLDDYTRFTTMEEVLREYVILVNVRKKQGTYHLYSYDEPGKKVFEDDPLVLLDGIPIFDLNKFMTYDPLKIRKLEVLNRKYFLGSSNYNGILNWSTYKGDFNSYELDPHATVLDYEGMQLQREFYSPVYDNIKQVISHLPDFRNVLYWAPEIITGKDGNKQLSFYTSDVPGKYAVMLQGITTDGISGSNMTTFEVK